MYVCAELIRLDRSLWYVKRVFKVWIFQYNVDCVDIKVWVTSTKVEFSRVGVMIEGGGGQRVANDRRGCGWSDNHGNWISESAVCQWYFRQKQILTPALFATQSSVDNTCLFVAVWIWILEKRVTVHQRTVSSTVHRVLTRSAFAPYFLCK